MTHLIATNHYINYNTVVLRLDARHDVMHLITTRIRMAQLSTAAILIGPAIPQLTSQTSSEVLGGSFRARIGVSSSPIRK